MVQACQNSSVAPSINSKDYFLNQIYAKKIPNDILVLLPTEGTVGGIGVLRVIGNCVPSLYTGREAVTKKQYKDVIKIGIIGRLRTLTGELVESCPG